jgi:hypothetical protein
VSWFTPQRTVGVQAVSVYFKQEGRERERKKEGRRRREKTHLDALLLDVLLLVVDARFLVLLVLSNEVLQVGLGLGELHLVHTLTSVPVKESLATDCDEFYGGRTVDSSATSVRIGEGKDRTHSRELGLNTGEELLDRSRVSDEGDGHLHSLGRDLAVSGLDVVGDPLCRRNEE